MNREQTAELLKHYKSFPETEIFSLRPVNYPLFHLMECFVKGWTIQRMYGWGDHSLENLEDVPFEKLAHQVKHDPKSKLWVYVARNPQLTNTTLGFVQADLYARYVGKCNPLKGPYTTWTFIPKLEASTEGFKGMIGKHTPLYQIEIDLDTTDIIGKRDDKLPWHYLQQTIDWKPWKGPIDWQEGDRSNVVDAEEPRRTILGRLLQAVVERNAI